MKPSIRKTYKFHTIIVGAGAAGMNCAVHLYEEFTRKGIPDAHKQILVLSRGLKLGASRMSGSDKQTYYKMGTSPQTPDSAQAFAQSLTAAGCCHHDLALIEGIGSLREFYHLVRAGVPFPHDALGSFVGYKTDHDPYERATSAGPKTSKFMSECLTDEARRYNIPIHDQQEVVTFLTVGRGPAKRIVGLVTLDGSTATPRVNVYYCDNLVLAAGGPGEMYKTTVYPRGQVGLHGLALEAGLHAENLTESQFGLASIKFRWNVSGTYMQVIPRIYSTDAAGNDPREFLADAFGSTSKMATDIFLKGYQWPFDPQRIADFQSSLVDVLVFKETQAGRRVWMDFLHNPVPAPAMKPFALADLEDEALVYLRNCGAMQDRPIDRLRHMNPPAIDIYAEHGIDLAKEPLEIALCAQHNNGGLAVNPWWESNIPHTFVIGEMAATHGVKRPGGSALNSGQVGGLRAATYIANAYTRPTLRHATVQARTKSQIAAALDRLSLTDDQARYTPRQVIAQVQQRMTDCAGHLREIAAVGAALADAVALFHSVNDHGLIRKARADSPRQAIIARHMALASVAYLKAIKEFLLASGGSRGSYLVVADADQGVLAHPSVPDTRTGRPLRIKPENTALRNTILRLAYNPAAAELFDCQAVEPRNVPNENKIFEIAWADYRQGRIFKQD